MFLINKVIEDIVKMIPQLRLVVHIPNIFHQVKCEYNSHCIGMITSEFYFAAGIAQSASAVAVC